MRTIKLSGELGIKFGKVHRFDVKTPAEAIRALCANFPEFKKELNHAHEKNIGYHVFNGSHQLESEKQTLDPASRVIRIAPVIMGANATARILIGATLIAVGVAMNITGVGAAASPYVISAGVGLMLGGVIEMLSPVPKIKEPDERPENKPSYLFNGPVNTTNQGHPVPIGYGRLRVGGGIVSAGISVDQIMAGYKRVRTDKTSNLNYFMTADGSIQPTLGTVEPANTYRKELVSFTKNGYEYFDGFHDLYVYKVYYYEINLVLVET